MGLCFSRKKSDPVSKCILDEKKVEKQIVVAAQPASAKIAAAETKPVFVVMTQTPKKDTAAAAAAAEEKGKKKGETPTKKSQQKEDTSNGSGSDRSALVVDVPTAPRVVVRTSSCTKEEVDAILIQCGRLSRSSSGNASNENGGGGHRKYSGSKRSYDFDNEKNGDGDDEDEDEEEEEPMISRPPPHRRTPSRDRSVIRERSSGGGRRVSRSPGKRSECPTSSASATDRSRQQPAKMVSVPAREKGGGGFAEGGGMAKKTVSSAEASKRGGERRSASPRSRSPANAATTRTGNENVLHHNPQPQSLSRSSSRKAEQSPGRRNPMAEIDENSLRRNQNGSSSNYYKPGEEGVRKLRRSQTPKSSENCAQMRKSEQRAGGAMEVSNGLRSNNVISSSVREQLIRCHAKDRQPGPEMVVVEGAVQVQGAPMDGGASPMTSVVVESPNPNPNPRTITRRSGSLKRCSRDFDHALGPDQGSHLNPTSYTSLLLQDIHNYHHQSTAFSLPACVSKACSILEAVADLNSSCSENNSSHAEGSDNNINGSLHGRFGRSGLVSKAAAFVESEIIVKDDLMEPSLHKYVSVRDLGGEMMEPQESAGSNSFIGQPWSSPWEPNSFDSTDRDWTSHSNNGEEVEQRQRQQQQESMPEIAFDSEARGRRPRGGSCSNSLPTTMSSGRKKRELDHHHHHGRRSRSGFGGGSGKASGGSRSSSIPAAAAASS